MVSFDPSRPEFKPYGFTCERWMPVPMQRADRHNEIELNLLKQGSLTYMMGGNAVTIPSRRLAVFWAALPHQIIAATDQTEYFVATIPLAWFLQCQFPAQLVDAVLHAQVLLDSAPQSSGGDLEMFERWVHDLEDREPMPHRIAFLEIEARLLRFAMALPVEPASAKRHRTRKAMIQAGAFNRVEQMVCFIAQHYTEPLTADQIAKASALHPNYAMALFKKSLGITLVDCVTQHRVSHAQRMLATTDEKVIEVAFSSGFTSLSRFHEAFKALCGCSPKEYRAKHRIGFD
jgi:AraC family transcriptional regulator, melibiose operon regulatory protein